MSLRSCIYKRCENYINLRDRSLNDVTLFSFPKNPERRKKWLELGSVPDNIPESVYFFCSDHFDKKFLAINNRRTVLVGEAVPFPYVESEIDESNRDEANFNYLVYDLVSNNNDGKQEYTNDQVVESTTITSDIQDNLDEQDFSTLDKDEPEEYIIFSDGEHSEEGPISYANKRKPESAFTQATSSKSKIMKTSQVQKLQNSSEESNETIKSISNKETCDEENDRLNELVDAKHVTTFIFKGEEYVQMPKDYYLNEKVELLKKMQNMEHTLQAIKGHINTLDI